MFIAFTLDVINKLEWLKVISSFAQVVCKCMSFNRETQSISGFGHQCGSWNQVLWILRGGCRLKSFSVCEVGLRFQLGKSLVHSSLQLAAYSVLCFRIAHSFCTLQSYLFFSIPPLTFPWILRFLTHIIFSFYYSSLNIILYIWQLQEIHK